MTDMIGGRRPWSIPVEPVRFITQGGDTQEQIDICLSCTLPESKCNGTARCGRIINAAAQYRNTKKQYKRRTYLVYDYQMMDVAVTAPGTIEQKIKSLDVSRPTYERWRARYYAGKSAKEAI